MAIITAITNEIGNPREFSYVGQMTLSLFLKKFYVRNHFKEAIQKQKVFGIQGRKQCLLVSIDLRVIYILTLFESMGMNEISNRYRSGLVKWAWMGVSELSEEFPNYIVSPCPFQRFCCATHLL